MSHLFEPSPRSVTPARFDFVRIASRLIMLVGGEAMQSAFHLAVNIALLHVLPARDYGVFALVLVMGGLGLTYIRALTALPASIGIAGSLRVDASRALEVTFGSGALLLSGLMMSAVALALEFWIEEGALMGAAFVGLWALRSHLRTVFFASNRQRIVSVSDLAFTLVGTLMAAAILRWDTRILPHMLAALAFANAVGILTLLGLARQPIRITFGAPMRRRYASMWRPLVWSFVSVTTTNLQGQGLALLVAGVAGPAAYAPIAAALVVFVPLRIVNQAFVNMLHPEMTALVRRNDQPGITRLLRLWPLMLGGVGVLYMAGVEALLNVVALPAFAMDRPALVMLLAWATCAIPMLYAVPRIVLESMLAFRTIAWLSALGAVVGLALVWIVLQTTTPTWALAGGAASEAVVGLGLWIMALRALQTQAVMPA